MTDPFRIDGRRALVTGANTGIGQAIAVGLAAAGAHVIAAGRSSCAETVAQIAAAGGSGAAMTLDLSDPAAGAARLAEAGDLDILVNNAGIIRRADSVDYAEADWDDVIDVNLKAVFLMCQAFTRAAFVRGAGGRIVNIATNNTDALRQDAKRSADILARIPAGRWGDPSDIAGAVTFLCSPAAGYVTGTVLNVDGGRLAR